MAALRGRDFTEIRDLEAAELVDLLRFAADLKARARAGDRPPLLAGKTLALVFEKPSLRTRTTFETGMFQLGGYAVYLGMQEIQMGARESFADIARNLDRWVDAIAARTFAQDTVTMLAEHARIPVINALSDREHPCQTLATLLTVQERYGRFAGLRLAWIGDGNNTLRSLLHGAVRLGISVAIAMPAGYSLDAETLHLAREAAAASHATVEVTDDPAQAVAGADVIYTDAWASMGQETEAAARRKAFASYQVNTALLAKAPCHAVVSHCLPAHRGEEITDEVLDGPRSVAFDEAENRLHTQKALLAQMLG